MTMGYVARRVLADAGISLTELVREAGLSKTTWSRLLNGVLATEPEGARARLEALLTARGVVAPAELWHPEPDPEDRGPGSNSPLQPQELPMQGHALSESARMHFKLFVSPFDGEALVDPAGGDHLKDLYQPIAHRFIEARLVQALTKAGFVALSGEPGSGKSTLLEKAYRGAAEIKPLVKVATPNIERRKLSAMHVSAEIIRQLSEEAVPRTANVRDALAAEVLRQRYEQGQRVVLVIDEAHELPDTTIKDLKRYHEMRHGFAQLLAIILVGQTELAQRFELERNHRLREAIIRCQLVKLPPMSGAGEVRGYMETRFGWGGASLADSWEPDAVDELARRLAVHEQQYPIIIGNIANAAMNLAYCRGNPRVTSDEVIDVCAARPDQLQAWGLA